MANGFDQFGELSGSIRQQTHFHSFSLEQRLCETKSQNRSTFLSAAAEALLELTQ
jgi:hypothetical protein